MSLSNSISYHPVDKHVGSRLKSRRVMVGMSQDELGKAVGVTFQQIQKYEKGSNRIGCSRLHEISSVLNTPIGFFFDDFNDNYSLSNGTQVYGGCAEEADNFKTENESASNKEILSLVRSYNNIKSIYVRKNVLALIRSLSDQSIELIEDPEDIK